MNFHAWAGSPGEPGRVLDLRVPGALDDLVERYGAVQPDVLREILSQAYRLGAQMAVVEYRYLDPDYRNEHSRFYSGTFRRYPSVAHRIHFWSAPPPEELDDPHRPATFPAADYQGYTVIRPVPGAPVGRTMLQPPEHLRPYIGCLSLDETNLFGVKYQVRASPFTAQDAQLGVCAHASLWEIAYYHHLEYQAPRYLPGEITDAAPAGAGVGRPTPSLNLTVNQLVEASRIIGLPCLLYKIIGSAQVIRLACPYLNSGIPVIVAGGGHAFTLVGYQPIRRRDGSKWIQFIRQDDEVGPYQEVNNVDTDDYAPWMYLIVPLPKKVYLSGEKAEALGIQRLRADLSESSVGEHQRLLERVNAQEVKFRTTLVRSNDFKRDLIDRRLEELTAAIYRRIGMSKWIWVVEATAVAERDEGNDCVLAEAVIDSTDHLRDLNVLARRIPQTLYQWLPDEDQHQVFRELPESPPLRCLARVSQRVT